MQYKHSFLITWSCFVFFLQYVQARVANPQDALVERSPAGLNGGSGFLGKVQNFVLGKRQQICVNDAYLQAIEDISLATDLCAQIIGLPSVTVVVDSTPVITTTKAVTTKYSTVTKIVRNTNTVVATVTASPTAAVQKRSAAPNADPVLALAEARDAAFQLLASATAEPSVIESFSSACVCRDIPATATTTIIYTELPEIQTVTAEVRMVTTVNTTRYASLTSTTVVQASSFTSTLSPAETMSLPSPTAALPSADPGFPISDVISCPEANNQTINVLLGSVRFEGRVLCESAIKDEDDLIRLPYSDVTRCAAACARANEEFSDTICRGITFDTSGDSEDPCVLKRSATVLTYAADRISLLFTAIAVSDNLTSYNRNYSPEDSPSVTTMNSAAVSSVFSTSVSFVTAPPVVQDNFTTFATGSASVSSLSQFGGFSWSMSSSWYFYYAATWYTLFEATVYSSEAGSAQTAFSGSGSSGGSAGGSVNVTAAISASASIITSAPEVIYSPVTTILGSSSGMNMSAEGSTTIFNGDEITIISGSATTILRAESALSGTAGFGTGGASNSMNWTAEYGSWSSAISASSNEVSGSVTILPFTNGTLIANSTAFSMSGAGSTGGGESMSANITFTEPTGTEAPRDGTASTEGTMDDNPRTGLQSMPESTITAENETMVVPTNTTSLPPGTITSSTNATNMTTSLSGTDGPRTGMQTLPTETSSTFGGSMNITSLLPTAMSSSSPQPSASFTNMTTSSCECPTVAGAVTVTRTISVVNCRATQCFPFYEAYADWYYSPDEDGSSNWDDGLAA